MKRSLLMMNLLLVAAFVGAVVASPAEGPLTQDEFDAIVEKEGFKFIHGDDWLAWIRHFRSRGVSDDMFITAFSKIARRTVDAADGTADAEKCMLSMASIPSFEPTLMQLTNVAFIAENAASDKARREAVWTYYGSTKGSEAFLDFAEKALSATNLQIRAEGELMSCLYNDAQAKRGKQGGWHLKMSRLMHRYVEKDVCGLIDADQILQWCEPEYLKTPLHRELRRRMLKPEYQSFIEKERGSFAAEILKRYREEEARKAGR